MARFKPSLGQRIWEGIYVVITVAIGVIALILIATAATRP